MWKYSGTSLGFPPDTPNLHLCGGNGCTFCILSVCWEDAGEMGHKVLCGSEVIRSTLWTEENPEALPHSILPISSSQSRILNLKKEFENPDFKRCSPRNFPKLSILWQEYLFDETLEGIKAITKTILKGSFQNKIQVLGKLVVVVMTSPVGNWRIHRQMLSLLREGQSWCGTWRYMSWRVRHSFLESDQGPGGPESSGSHIPSQGGFLQASPCDCLTAQELGRAVREKQCRRSCPGNRATFSVTTWGREES